MQQGEWWPLHGITLHTAALTLRVMTENDLSEVLAALRQLPDRQREVLVLRYYADLSEAQIAEAIGISRGAVKSHASRGMAALRTTLEQSS